MMWIIISAVLLTASVVLAVRIAELKTEMRNIRDELEQLRETSYNRQLTVNLIDKDLTEMAAEMNRNLEFQKQLKFRSEQAERTLKHSVSDIAHDLRTPLTVINGSLQMLEQEGRFTPKGEDYLRVCREKSVEMKAMADDFFELVLLESDTALVETGRVNATNLLMQFLADNEALICSRNFVPEVVFPEKTVFINADEALLTRMLGNLLNNVLKYASEQFRLELRPDGKKCEIIFSNEIIDGQTPDTERIFERTYRADGARNGGGAGLGLYIVRLLAERQGAAVKAETERNFLSLILIFDTENAAGG